MKKRIFLIFIAFFCAFLSIFTVASNKVLANNITMRTVIRLHTSMIYITRGSQSSYQDMRNKIIGGYITDVTLRAYVVYADGTSKTLNLHGISGDDYSYGYDNFKFTYIDQITSASSQNIVVSGPVSFTRTDTFNFFGGAPDYSIYLHLLRNDGKYLRFLDESDYTGNINIVSNIYFKADMIITGTSEGMITLTNLDVTPLDWDVFYSFPSYDDAYNAGYNDGYRAGGGFSSEDRYRQGYNDGYNAGVSGTITTNWFTSFISSIFSIFDVEIFPGVKIIYLIFIPLGLGILALILKLIRG